MPITLDPKTSVPQNPTAVVQLFQNIQKEYTPEKLKEIFEEEKSQKAAAERRRSDLYGQDDRHHGRRRYRRHGLHLRRQHLVLGRGR